MYLNVTVLEETMKNYRKKQFSFFKTPRLHILKVLLYYPYLDTCKHITNITLPYECSFQKDANKPDTRNLSLFQILLKT